MPLLQYLYKARAAHRAGYKMHEISRSPNGRIFETATGHEICAINHAPFQCEQTPKGQIITFFEKNSDTPFGHATAHKGDQS